MTPQEFKQARKALKLTQTELAHSLGLSKSQIVLFERGRRYDNDEIVEVPKAVRLAMVALDLGYRDWSADRRSEAPEPTAR